MAWLIVVHGKPDVYVTRGTLSLQAFDIRPVGVGELLARLERRKGVLAAEGLFDPDRKRPLPFLPAVVGLVTGRASAFDNLIAAIGAALEADRTLGGLCDWVEPEAPASVDLPIEGAAALKAAVITVVLHYTTTGPLA